jgi:Holliday junction resolvase RusA-like endonuclease
MRSQTFILLGDPKPLARARFSRYAVYDSQKHEKLIDSLQLSHQMDNQPLFSGPLILSVTFFMPTGKQKKRSGTPHFFKSDLDNLLKYVCDISNHIIFHDDAAIYKIIANKIYDTNPRTVFTITEYIESNNASS